MPIGKRIEDLPAYGSYDLVKMLDDIYEVSKNSGSPGFPVYAPDGSRQITLGEIHNLYTLLNDDVYLRLDGTVPMQGDIDMDGNDIKGIDSLRDSFDVRFIYADPRYMLDMDGNVIANFYARTQGFGISTNLDKYLYIKSDFVTDNRTLQFGDYDISFPIANTAGCFYSDGVGGFTWEPMPDSDLFDPVAPSPDGKYYYEQVFDEVKAWVEDIDAYGTTIAVVNKLQAEGASDWSASGVYVGTTSGAITIGTDCKAGERFPGVGDISLSDYIYECFPDGWRRTAIAL